MQRSFLQVLNQSFGFCDKSKILDSKASKRTRFICSNSLSLLSKASISIFALDISQVSLKQFHLLKSQFRSQFLANQTLDQIQKNVSLGYKNLNNSKKASQRHQKLFSSKQREAKERARKQFAQKRFPLSTVEGNEIE